MVTQNKLGKNLKNARLKSGFTQKKLSEIAGLNSNYYARIERGEENFSFEILEKICKALRIKSSEIMPF
jgi:transcriptional regulator with XRE-family HTH domain